MFFDRTGGSTESLATERDSQGEAAVTVNNHLKIYRHGYSQGRKEGEGERG